MELSSILVKIQVRCSASAGFDAFKADMLSNLIALISLMTILLLHQAIGRDVQKEITILESISHLISNRPSHVSWIPSVAYEAVRKNEYQQRQFIKDQKYEQQIELILAELQSHLVGTPAARDFFKRATVYGLPSFDNLRFYNNFMYSYDNRLKQAAWSLEHLRGINFKIGRRGQKPPKRFRCYPDKWIHKQFRGTHQDYKLTGYDRGHMVAVCNHKCSQINLNQAFLMTNTAPRFINLNRMGCVWFRLENYVAHLAARTENLYVITGTLFKPYKDKRDLRYRVLGMNRVAVPTHFYKVLLYEDLNGNMLMEAFGVQNSNLISETEKLETFRIDVYKNLDKLERAANLKFFYHLDRAKIWTPTRFQYNFIEQFSNMQQEDSC